MPVDVPLRSLGLVALGSALGGSLRFLVQAWLTRQDFPWGTVAVNLVGSFLIGVFMFGALARGTWAPEVRIFVAVGLLGGFTTMSTFAYETLALAEGGEALRAFGYAALTIGGSLVMVYLGRLVGRLPFGGA